MSIAAFMLLWQSSVAAIHGTWLTKPKIVSLWPFQEMFADLFSSLIVHFSFSLALAIGYKLFHYYLLVYLFVSPL